MGSPVILPAAQSVQAVDASLSSSTVPDAQSMQESVPAAAYLPIAQLAQPVLSVSESTHLVLESVPAFVRSVENVTTAPFTAETVRSEPSGAAVHVWSVAETNCTVSPT